MPLPKGWRVGASSKSMEARVAGRAFDVTLVVYGGDVPLLGGRIAGALAEAEQRRGVVVNKAFVEGAGELEPETRLTLMPGEEFPVVAIVWDNPRIDPVPKIFVPGSSIPELTNSASAAFYLANDTSPQDMAEWLRQKEAASYPGLRVRPVAAVTRYASRVREARAVAALAVMGALLVAFVALVNTMSFTSLWVLGRSRGFALRRTLGAPPKLIRLYVIFDLLVIFVGALAVGLAVAGVISVRWAEDWGLPPLTPLAAGSACLVMAMGTFIVSIALSRMVTRVDPGVLLGRAL